MLDPDDPRHGTPNGYGNLGCHCRPCQLAWNAQHLAYMKRHPEQYAKSRERERLQRDPDGSKAKQREAERRARRRARQKRRAEQAMLEQRRVELRTLIRDLHAAGMRYAHIADLFNERGIPTLRPNGRAWNRGTIWTIVNKEEA